jgi:imidazole glycerol-phosphate synthase subunit HisH
MIGILDYGMGNLRSVQKGFEHVGAAARIVREPDEIGHVRRLVLPGVGAFGDAMEHLRGRQLVDPILAFIRTGRPFLGICLGLQLLFESSEEDGGHEGLGVFKGRVVRFRPIDKSMKVPHMGWNALRLTQPACALFHGLGKRPSVYFVHSFHAAPADETVTAAVADYGGEFCAAVHAGNVFACQFHPEKSQRVGLRMLANFSTL